ncbi:MAG: cell wall hydrolase [Lachnospiraceae bacterium]|nr:cell wall hydrolase [Lachnospiraceae bacterium]
MYKKYVTILLLGHMILAVSWLNVKGITVNRIASTAAFQLRFMEDFEEVEETSLACMVKRAASDQRVVDCDVLEREMLYELSEEDYEVLLRIVEAEAGCEDVKGRMLVAGVILNRVTSDKFPDTVKQVVFQQENGVAQFSPIKDGRYYNVCVSDETIEAVTRVLYGEDLSEGALYFASRKYANPERMQWFDNHLTLLFSYGGHEFFL